MKMAFLLSVLALSTPVQASGQSSLDLEVDRRLSAVYRRCSEAAGGYTRQILACDSAETAKQDRSLNWTYQKVMKRLSRPERAKLRGLERAWIARHDSDCFRSSGGKWGGTRGSIEYSGCILEETIKRTIWLERYRG
jgi:uncharacterized protein YecT (DUF1311 family)